MIPQPHILVHLSLCGSSLPFQTNSMKVSACHRGLWNKTHRVPCCSKNPRAILKRKSCAAFPLSMFLLIDLKCMWFGLHAHRSRFFLYFLLLQVFNLQTLFTWWLLQFRKNVTTLHPLPQSNLFWTPVGIRWAEAPSNAPRFFFVRVLNDTIQSFPPIHQHIQQLLGSNPTFVAELFFFTVAMSIARLLGRDFHSRQDDRASVLREFAA